jgi:cyanophycin synthetase
MNILPIDAQKLEDVYSSRAMLYKAFIGVGYQVQELHIDGAEFARFTSPRGAVWMTDATRISYPMVHMSIAMIARDKTLSSELVSSQGMSIPESLAPSDERRIRQLLDEGYSLVVKPSDGSGSKGLTLDIRSFEQLQAAIIEAEKVSDAAIIQEQVSGDELRFTIIDGEVVSVLLRSTPRVIGDGHSTVKELIEKENGERSSLDIRHITYPQLIDELITHQIDKSLIPEAGAVVELSRSTLVRGGASIYELRNTVHGSYNDIARKIAGLVGASFMTVDLIVHDYAAPATDDNYWFLECNTAPSLRLYYSCRSGENVDMLHHIVRAVDTAIHTSSVEE